MPLRWATAQANLGTTVRMIGEREGRAGRLEEAVALLRTALEELTPERASIVWAKAQLNLGIALRVLGEQESGTQRLREAAAVFDAVLAAASLQSAPGLTQAALAEREITLTAIARRTDDLAV